MLDSQRFSEGESGMEFRAEPARPHDLGGVLEVGKRNPEPPEGAPHQLKMV